MPSTERCWISRLSIVTINWNGAADTLACIESIESAGPPDIELIVVDNGSAPDDVAVVAAALQTRHWSRLIRNAENVGFAAGCNAGIAAALAGGADFVLLLNNDAVLEAGACEALVSHMESHPKTAFASPLILDGAGDRIWALGGTRAAREVVCRLGLTGRARNEAPIEPSSSYALIGCAMIGRRAAFEAIGMFDEAYFAYVEDVDLSRRAADAGWSLDVVPIARVRHRVSAATGGGYTPLRSYLLGRGTALFVRKRADTAQRIGFALAAPLGLAAAFVRELATRGRTDAVWAKARGYVDGLLARPVDGRYFER